MLPLEGAFLQSMAATVVNILKSVPLATQVTVRFPDGSQVALTYDQWTNTATVVPGSAQDGLGNPIPTSWKKQLALLSISPAIPRDIPQPA